MGLVMPPRCSNDRLSTSLTFRLSLNLAVIPCNREAVLLDPCKFDWLFCLISLKGLRVGVRARLSNIPRKLFEDLESWRLGPWPLLSFISKHWGADYCLLKPKGVKLLWLGLATCAFFLWRAIIGLRLPLGLISNLFWGAKHLFPSSFSLLFITGERDPIVILWTLTGVELSWDCGLTTLMRTGVDAFEILINGFIKLGFNCVGGWMLLP